MSLKGTHLRLAAYAAVIDPETINFGEQILRAFAAAGIEVSLATRELNPPSMSTDVLIVGKPAEMGILTTALHAGGLSITAEKSDVDLKIYIGPKRRPQ